MPLFASVSCVDDCGNFLKGFADSSAHANQAFFDLGNTLDLIFGQGANGTEDELGSGLGGLFVDLPATVGAKGIAGDDENIDLRHRLAGIFTFGISGSPDGHLWVEVGHSVVQQGNQILTPGAVRASTAEESAARVQGAVIVDLHRMFLSVLLDVAAEPPNVIVDKLHTNYNTFYIKQQCVLHKIEVLLVIRKVHIFEI